MNREGGKVKGEGCEEDRIRRLRWRCRRGLLELDVWLEQFASKGLQQLTESQCELFERLLQEADADLLAWFQGQQPVPEDYEEMIAGIRAAV